MSHPTEAVRTRYAAAARGEGTACCGSSRDATALSLGYSDKDLDAAGEANLGLGCGNPIALAAIEPGMTVVDLGSGAGFDALLAAERVGPTGRVIGVDMTPEMLELARRNAAARGATNVEFREGRLESLPVDDASVDLVVSNCVINLTADKPAVFREIARVLRPGGRVMVSDLVLVDELPAAIRQSVLAYVGCVAGALPLGAYIALLLAAGFDGIAVPQIRAAGAMLAGLDRERIERETAMPWSAEDVARAARSVVSASFAATRSARSPELDAACCTSGAACECGCGRGSS